MKIATLVAFLLAAVSTRASSENDRPIKFRARKLQNFISADGTCPTMIPPSPLAPDDSTCWQWWDPPSNGVMPPGVIPPKGCDYEPCQDAVCACDDYCCTTAWDLSCRGYESAQGDGLENNYFVDGCSAKILCCEQESAYPDPPIGGAISGSITISKAEATISGGMAGGASG